MLNAYTYIQGYLREREIMGRITNIQAYDMANKELIDTALELAYKVGELETPRDMLDYAASMSALITEIKYRAILRKFEIKASSVEE